jgi:DNA-binding SARP family transcriptional activator
MSAPTHDVRQRPRTFTRWIGSLLGLAGLVLGIPLVLIACGVTPPLALIGHIGAHPTSVAHYLSEPFSDSALTKVLIFAAWIVWLWLVVCVMAETAGSVRGRPTMHLPASRHIQSFAAALVGASLAVVPIGIDGLPMRLQTTSTVVHRLVGEDNAVPRSHGPVRTVAPPASPASRRPRSSGTGPAAHLLADVGQLSTEMTIVSYVVQPGDTLWSIAEKQLGSPLRWPEIAKLNYGRIQPDGGDLTDAHWIFPGWELVLPASPVVSSALPVVERMSGSTAAAVHLKAAIATERTSRSPGPAASAAGQPGSHRGSDDGEKRDHEESETTPSDGNGPSRSRLPLGVVGYGVLGTGVVVLLERLRRVQRRHRPNGLRIALPEGDLAALERRLRVESDPEGVDVIDLGLRALVAFSLRCEMMPPPVTVVRLGPDDLEITLDPSRPTGRVPPHPFRSDENRQSWLLSRDLSTIRALGEDPDIVSADAPFPALVTIGRDEFGVVLIDLEHAASIDVTETTSVGILGTVAVELATAKWADQVDLILVGFDQALEALERVSQVPTIVEMLSRVHRRVRERSALLASVGRTANWEIRWTEGGDAWDLCVVLCAADAVEADPDGAAALARLAGNGGLGLAVVLGAPTGAARWNLNVHDGRIDVGTKGTSASAFRSPSDDTKLSTAVASLVEVAGQLDGVLPTEPPYDKIVDKVPDTGVDTVTRHTVEAVDGATARKDARFPDEGGADLREVIEVGVEPGVIEVGVEVEVRVLGPVEIFGAARPFARAWAIELIVYLAMHRNGASSEQWATALWPDRIMASASLHSTASAARRSLGVSIAGEDHLPRAHGRLALGPSVRSDWNRFVELAERDEPESWHRALELIRGRPFEGLRAPDWVLLEGIAANVEAVVVDLASRYCEHCLSVGDPGGAEWSARQGLRVSAYDERLYRILLRAADAAGNPAGVESVMTELVRLVADDVEPYDAVHPETLDLYRSLSRRPTPLVRR